MRRTVEPSLKMSQPRLLWMLFSLRVPAFYAAGHITSNVQAFDLCLRWLFWCVTGHVICDAHFIGSGSVPKYAQMAS